MTLTTATATAPSPVLAFDVAVTRVRDIGPDFRRITFGGESLRSFGVQGPTRDLRIKIMIPSIADGREVPLPDLAGSIGAGHGWYQQWRQLDPATRGSMRTYTVRADRSGAAAPEIDVDFVLHVDAGGHGGPASNWAAAAKPGDGVVLIGPNIHAANCATAESYGGIEWRPGLAQRVLIAGDETAVPAISAILESLPEDITGHAILEVPDAADFQDIRTRSNVQIIWLARGAHPGTAHGELLDAAVRRAVAVPGWVEIKDLDAAGPEPEDVNIDEAILWETPLRLDAAVAAQGKNPGKPAGALPFYAWIAGEAGVIKELRRYLVRDVGIDRKQVAFMGYWRQGKAELS
jgi:iron complex transport system ATP-binding protein